MIYVDDYLAPAAVRNHGQVHRSRWSHLFTDSGDLEELHAFAERIGLRREMAQLGKPAWAPHYDVTEGKRNQAIRAGARKVTAEEATVILRAAHERRAAGAAVQGEGGGNG